MCLILFACNHHSRYRLVFAANRDEFYSRPSLAMDYWPEAPQVLSGLDVQGGGTWMGITRTGRFAAITNFRDPASLKPDAPSRGHLVSGYLTGEQSPDAYLGSVAANGSRYNGFNLLTGDRESLYYTSNRSNGVRKISSGLYGLSNRLLDTPWPKVERGKRALDSLLATADNLEPDAIFDILQDRTRFPDNRLPDTGVGLDWERMLSPLFISSPDYGYGTRCATVVLWDRAGHIDVWERTYVPARAVPTPENTRHFAFQLPATDTD